MFAKLRGMVDTLGTDQLVLDVGGVGYLVHASGRTLSMLAPNTEASLLIETVVREDAITLFGFGDVQEKAWFSLLTSVQGVGAKVGLAILSTLSTAEIEAAIVSGDKSMIARTNGVGPKLAQRICGELKDKVGSIAAAPMTTAGDKGSAKSQAPTVDSDAIAALESLGYSRSEAHRAVVLVAADNADADTSSLVKHALKALSQ